MEKKVGKRLLAVALCLAMLLTIIPVMNFITKAADSTEYPFYVTDYNTGFSIGGRGIIQTQDYSTLGGAYWLHVAFKPITNANGTIVAYEIVDMIDGYGTDAYGTPLDVPTGGFAYCLHGGNVQAAKDMYARAATWSVGERFVFKNIDFADTTTIPTNATYATYVESEVEPEPEPELSQQYVSLPITIRDYAADGMLFEFNELGRFDTITSGSDETITYSHVGGAADKNWGKGTEDYTGFRIQYYNETVWTEACASWQCVVFDRYNGTVIDVIPAMNDEAAKIAAVEAAINNTSTYASLWLWSEDPQYSEFCSLITKQNKNNYRITFSLSDGSLWITKKAEAFKRYSCVSTSNTDWGLGSETYTGFRIQKYGETLWQTAYETWHCVICQADGKIVQVLPATMSASDKSTAYSAAMKDGFHAVWLWKYDPQYSEFSFLINESNINDFAITYDSSSNEISVKRRSHNNGTENFLLGNTAGFGLLSTGAVDYINNLSIAGSSLILNGDWGLKTDPTAIKTTLNSGAPQDVFGAYIRTDLVQPKLGANGKPIYTEATVEYLANYLETMLNVPYEVNGYRTGYYVTGTKLFDASGKYVGKTTDAVYDLAEILRQSINGKADANGVLNRYNATTDEHSWYTFGNAYGYVFSIDDVNGHIDGEDSTIITNATAYESCNFKQSTSVVLEPVEGKVNEYKVIKVVVNPETSTVANITWNKETIVMVINSSYKTSDEVAAINWMDKTAASALQPGDVVTISNNRTTVAVESKSVGTYTDAKAKYDAGNLSLPTEVTTYYDAAYYLLHNIWMDSSVESDQANNYGTDGYGWNAKQYNMVNLVEKEDSSGNKYYVFNSGYDNAVYDINSGAIYNSQTETITGAQSEGKDTYVRGNKLPAARFDPLGTSGVGKGYCYGDGTDLYGDLLNHRASWAEYYTTTNYHLSLEGHAQFIYQSAANQYFTFVGDDDVYLYINGVRVLDLGAAHSISKASIDLNNVAELCGLVDGQTYTFDFFYAERHGTAANFGIETNIQIVDASMVTGKTGYQDGVNTGYNGYVDPDEPIIYEFTLENHGKAAVQELTFTDGRLGVKLTKDTIVLNSETKINNLTVTVYFADGTIKESIAAGDLTEEKLKALLETGLAVNEKIAIYGFTYTVPSRMWETRQYQDANGNTVTSNEYFYNILNTTGKSNVGLNSSVDLSGTSNWVVQKMGDYKFNPVHLYTWGHLDTTLTNSSVLTDSVTVTLNRSEVEAQIKAVSQLKNLNLSNAKVQLCNASGNTSLGNYRARVNSDGSITYTPTHAGADTYYYKVGAYGPVPVDVYTYGAAPIPFVVDYGLSVELNGEKTGIEAKNVLSLTSNPNSTITNLDSVNVGSASNKYGTFTYDVTTKSLKYNPSQLMNGVDSVGVTISIKETGATKITKFTGVEMTTDVVVVPANVVYYEEDFPGLVYNNPTDSKWESYETVKDGNSTVGTNQSADQFSNYGSDPNYSVDKEGTLTEKTESITEAGDASNGTVKKIVVNKTGTIMSFKFHGTGFEILSRTTMGDYGVLSVAIKKRNEQGIYQNYKMQPVITESVGGDLYQVPVISATGLEQGDYEVIVQASGSRFDGDGNCTLKRVVYIDGIRIYDPLSNALEEQYYNKKEYNADISEVKDLINDGKLIYADIPFELGNVSLITGSTLIEDKEGNWVLTAGDQDAGTTIDKEAYMTHGPNNELYLNANNMGANVIAFFATPDINISENERTIQIGVHRKSDSLMEFKGYASLVYGSTAASVVKGHNYHEIASGTEQYYTIDVKCLEKGADGRYLVMIGTNGSENLMETLSLTSIKVAGYTISSAQNEILRDSESGELSSNGAVNALGNILNVFNSKDDDILGDGGEGDTSDNTTDDVTGGTTDDNTDTETDGTTDGTTDTETDGTTDGTTDTETDGITDGTTDTETDGTTDGTTDTETDGTTDDTSDDEADNGANESSFDIRLLLGGIALLCAVVLIIVAIVSFVQKNKKGER